MKKKPEQPSKKLRLSNLPYDAYEWMHNFYLSIRKTENSIRTDASPDVALNPPKEKAEGKNDIKKFKEKPAAEPNDQEKPNKAGKREQRVPAKMPAKCRPHQSEDYAPMHKERQRTYGFTSLSKPEEPLPAGKAPPTPSPMPLPLREPINPQYSFSNGIDKWRFLVAQIEIVYELLNKAKTSEETKENLMAVRKEIERVMVKTEERRKTDKDNDDRKHMDNVREDIILLTIKLDQIEKGAGFTEDDYALLKEKAKLIAAMWERGLTLSPGKDPAP